jgi:uncharacterized protein YndB with AHSA1/START domain
MEIHDKAPAVARAETQIAADPESVWRLLTDLEKWPTWKHAVRSVALHGSLAPGTLFVWQAGPGTISSTLQEVDPPRAISWTGSTMGIKAIDTFRLEPRDGGTFVREAESWEGLVARLFAGRLRRTLQASIESGLVDLKAEAERRVVVSAGQNRDQERRAS